MFNFKFLGKAVSICIHCKLLSVRYKHKFSKTMELKEVKEGEESFRDFWKAIGGKSSYCSSLKGSLAFSLAFPSFNSCRERAENAEFNHCFY